ncbi:unnamed protein product, partial [Allacma fusca]
PCSSQSLRDRERREREEGIVRGEYGEPQQLSERQHSRGKKNSEWLRTVRKRTFSYQVPSSPLTSLPFAKESKENPKEKYLGVDSLEPLPPHMYM